MTDDRFDRDLRDVLAASAPSDLPDALRRFVVSVPQSAAAPRSVPRRRLASASRGAFALVGVAAAVILAVVLGAGRMGMGPLVGPGASPTATPAASTAGPTLVYRVLPVDGRDASASQLARLGEVVDARLLAIDVTASVRAEAGRLIVALPPGADIEGAAALAGARGRVDFVPLGTERVEVGEPLDLSVYRPMFSGAQVTRAAVAPDDAGQPATDLTLDADAAARFATYTADNVGGYFAIVLDGITLVAPQIAAEVNDGQVRITGGTEGAPPLGDPRSLVAIVESGELSHPLELVSALPGASPGADPPSSHGTTSPNAADLTLAGRVLESCESIGGCAYFVKLVAPDGEVFEVELVGGAGDGVLDPGTAAVPDLGPGPHVITATSRPVADEVGNGERELGPEDARCEATFDVAADQGELHVEAVFDRAGCVITVGPR